MQTQTLNISLPRELIKKVDVVARKEYRNRSGLISEALRVYLKGRQEWQEIFEYGRQKAKELGIKSEREIDDIVYEFRHGRKPR